VARLLEEAVVTTATGTVLGLALMLVVVVSNAAVVSPATKWALLLLALVAGVLAALRQQGT
jgi:hypothetical protein